MQLQYGLQAPLVSYLALRAEETAFWLEKLSDLHIRIESAGTWKETEKKKPL